MKKSINQILDNLAYKKFYLLPLLITFSFILRLVVTYFVRDAGIENEWGVLLDNLSQHNSYSFFSFNGKLVPSVLLPPMYAFFIYLIKIITSFIRLDLLFDHIHANSFVYLCRLYIL